MKIIMEEHQNCPICFEIPEQEIYQCLKGHVVCANCKARLQDCPQCREPYGPEMVRNLVLEQILDALTFDCSHKEEGCEEVLKRQDISQHANICPFGKRLIRLCQKLGYDDCNHEVDSSNPSLIIKHFEEEHGAASSFGNELFIWHTDFAGVTASTKNIGWSPVLISLEGSEGSTTALFMILGRVDANRDCASWMCIQIFRSPGGNSSEIYDVEFGILGKDENSRVLPIKWTIPVVYPEDDVNSIKYSRVEIPLWFISSLCLKKEDIPIHVMLHNRHKPEASKLETPPEVHSISFEIPESSQDADNPEGAPQGTSYPQQPGKRIRGVFLWTNL